MSNVAVASDSLQMSQQLARYSQQSRCEEEGLESRGRTNTRPRRVPGRRCQCACVCVCVCVSVCGMCPHDGSDALQVTATTSHCTIRSGIAGYIMFLTKEACTARNTGRRCLSDLGWNADGVASVFLFLIFFFGFREACQKDSLNLGGRLVDGRSGEALVWVLGNTDPREERDREQRVRRGRGRAHGWCGMRS